MSQAATKPVKKGVSLWADAWRRLKKNKMAMAGLVVVVVMSAVCSLAGLIAPFDATYGFTWIGAQPPGFTHANTLNKTALVVGKAADLPAAYAHARELAFTVRESAVTEYRVEVRRRRIRSIKLLRGARPVERLEIPEGEGYLAEVLENGARGEPLDLRVLEEKQKPPEVFGDKRVIILQHVLPAQPVTYQASLEDGVVTSLAREGGPAVEGEDPLERVEFDGRHVEEVVADGRPQRVTHLLGTDLSGRDLFSRILYGGQISLLVGLVATIVSLLIGVTYGAISGYAGGRVDGALMAVVDILYGIPYMFLVILLLVNFGRDIIMLFIALGAVQWLTMARIVRGQILSLKQKEFVEAARMSGTGPGAILFRHLVPNTLGVVIVYTTLTVPAVILQESFLAFIGLAVTHQGQNLESWGALVKAGVDALGGEGERSWLLIWPSLAMAVTLFSLNFLGDGLRDALDPQQRGRT